ncbi:hypothetical protein B0H14DRAFT_2628974 [Mycena olivaceomarginata]|nr:hypothetical protein B0H14DRAFT_2628974 [Mycena olivaceomarginata]
MLAEEPSILLAGSTTTRPPWRSSNQQTDSAQNREDSKEAGGAWDGGQGALREGQAEIGRRTQTPRLFFLNSRSDHMRQLATVPGFPDTDRGRGLGSGRSAAPGECGGALGCGVGACMLWHAVARRGARCPVRYGDESHAVRKPTNPPSVERRGEKEHQTECMTPRPKPLPSPKLRAGPRPLIDIARDDEKDGRGNTLLSRPDMRVRRVGGLVRDGECTIAGREYERRGMCERERVRGGVRIRQGVSRAGRHIMGASGECAVGAGPVGAMEAASGADVCGARSTRKLRPRHLAHLFTGTVETARASIILVSNAVASDQKSGSTARVSAYEHSTGAGAGAVVCAVRVPIGPRAPGCSCAEAKVAWHRRSSTGEEWGGRRRVARVVWRVARAVSALILEAPEDKERLAQRQEAGKGRRRPVLHGIHTLLVSPSVMSPSVIHAQCPGRVIREEQRSRPVLLLPVSHHPDDKNSDVALGDQKHKFVVCNSFCRLWQVGGGFLLGLLIFLDWRQLECRGPDSMRARAADDDGCRESTAGVRCSGCMRGARLARWQVCDCAAGHEYERSLAMGKSAERGVGNVGERGVRRREKSVERGASGEQAAQVECAWVEARVPGVVVRPFGSPCFRRRMVGVRSGCCTGSGDVNGAAGVAPERGECDDGVNDGGERGHGGAPAVVVRATRTTWRGTRMRG